MGKSKNLTEKDVLYALEFAHERLIKTITHGKRHPAEYSLSPSGNEVPHKVAQSILNSSKIIAVEDGLLPGQSQTFVWRDAA